MDKEERTRLERLVAIEERISNNKYPTMRALCQAFNVRPRTIYADIRLLRERFGIDVRFDRFHSGYVNASPGKRIPIGDLVEDDHIFLMIGCAMLGSLFGTKMHDALRGIKNSMAKRLSFDVDEVEFEGLFVRPTYGKTSIEPNVLLQLGRALLENRAVELQIEGGSPHMCSPCCFFEDAGNWYLVGYNINTLTVEKHELVKINQCDIREEHSAIDRKELMKQFLGDRQ